MQATYVSCRQFPALASYVMNELSVLPSGMLNTTCRAVDHHANRPLSSFYQSTRSVPFYSAIEYASAAGYSLRYHNSVRHSVTHLWSVGEVGERPNCTDHSFIDATHRHRTAHVNTFGILAVRQCFY